MGPALPTPPTSQSHPAGSNFPQPPFPKTETAVFDRITAWIQDGRCSNSVGAINLKQAAYLLLVGAWLQATLNRAWGFTTALPPFQASLLLGGPGTGKTFITNCAADLLHFFLPSSTLQAAFTHRAARLVAGHRRTNSARRFGLTF